MQSMCVCVIDITPKLYYCYHHHHHHTRTKKASRPTKVAWHETLREQTCFVQCLVRTGQWARRESWRASLVDIGQGFSKISFLGIGGERPDTRQASPRRYVDSSPLLPPPTNAAPSLSHLDMGLLVMLSKEQTPFACLYSDWPAFTVCCYPIEVIILLVCVVITRCLRLVKTLVVVGLRVDAFHLIHSVVTSMQGERAWCGACWPHHTYSVLAEEGITNALINKRLLIKRTITHYLLGLATRPSLTDLRGK